jgi:hypothetical protein
MTAALNRKPTAIADAPTPAAPKKLHTGFAIDKFADAIVAHCDGDKAKIQELKEIAKKFSSAMASAIASAVDRNERE